MQYNQILIVEDDFAVGQSLKAGLERDGFAVTWKTTGADGLTFALWYFVHAYNAALA